jgi:nitroreductase
MLPFFTSLKLLLYIIKLLFKNMTDFEEIINTRRSIREYQERDVSDEDILKILKAGMQAPGSRLGAEPWEFVVIKNKDTLSRLGEIKPRVTNAPVAIVLVANIDRAFYKTVWQQDMGAACENMLLEAVNLGLGALWNGVAPEEERMQKIGEIIGIDDITTLKPYSIVTVGYPADGWENKFMDKFDETRIHYEKY